ncbi:MAG TPA: carboxypeptidase-like regulatory domain-containing protein [Candidatus Eisenbacteria bacterium]|nr:carboxypeptidase-like regulatory domain-containing protein [Candidatus Eisenbacteria bacterium]
MNASRVFAWTLATLFLISVMGYSQDSKKEAQLRTVHGVVSDKSDNPLPGSIVFLKNLRTNGVRSNFADDSGEYRFSGLDPNADYEIHAEQQGAKSSVRSISSLDSRKEMVINLKIDRKKS